MRTFLFNIINFPLIVITICLILQSNAQKIETTTSIPTDAAVVPRSTSVVDSSPRKRDVQITDLNTANTLESKHYDPPPEYYNRAPSPLSSTASSAQSYFGNYNNKQILKTPLSFPDAITNRYSPPDTSSHLANSYNSWQQLKTKASALLNKNSIANRISVGHYNGPEHTSPTGITTGYATHQYQPIEYIPSSSHPPHIPAGYYGSTAGAIPFDVYGSKDQQHHHHPDYSSYASIAPDVHDGGMSHKTFPELSQKAILAKSFLIPLASAAVLGIAAALVSNPLLLQLGTVSGIAPAGLIGKRKRRDLKAVNDNLNVSPYRSHYRKRLIHA